jgi:hypothetical protein
VSAPRLVAKRIVLRLDPARLDDAPLARALQLAKALHAELAARMVADTRLAGAFAVAGGADIGRSIETQLRRAEASFRRSLAALAASQHAAWTFEVIHCAGRLAGECPMASDDVVAIEVPPVEFSASELRAEIEDGLAQARGVLLLPTARQTGRGPVVAITGERRDTRELTATAREIAAALQAPLSILEHDGQSRQAERQEAGDIATAVRRLGAALAVIDAADGIVAALLARPRNLREMATPLLLLKV